MQSAWPLPHPEYGREESLSRSLTFGAGIFCEHAVTTRRKNRLKWLCDLKGAGFAEYLWDMPEQ